MSLLEKINKTGDIKRIPEDQLDALAAEIREYMLDVVSKNGGHLASSLGSVEITIALHRALSIPEDRIIWDVGHQAYTHKILTGRRKDFAGLREYDGISGFPKPSESEADPFATGHASTSISAALGLCRARDLSGGKETIVSVIGDGALTGGMAYEALNDASTLKSNLVIILNDNKMSISENVGGLSGYLNKIRTRKGYGDLKDDVEEKLSRIPGIGPRLVREIKKQKDGIRHFLTKGDFFEDIGINYIGPIDGHNISELVSAINAAKRYDRTVLIHAITQKGKGYGPAEKSPSRFHGVDPFTKETGEAKGQRKRTYTDIAGATLKRMAADDEKITAVCAAMAEGTGLVGFKRAYPDRFFDVGIAEEHAVTMAAGMASGGLKPFVAIYSTFLQRAYDQIIHDVCMEDLNVKFLVDRAGIVGKDGETHQGIFDISFLLSCPNMTVMAPKNKYELYDMLKFMKDYEGPCAIRYPRGEASEILKEKRDIIKHGKSELIFKGETVALLALGAMNEDALKVREMLIKNGTEPTLVNMRFAKPLDEEMLKDLSKEHKLIVTLEENVISGGMGEAVDAFYLKEGISTDVLNIGLPDAFIKQGDRETLKKHLGLDPVLITHKIMERL